MHTLRLLVIGLAIFLSAPMVAAQPSPAGMHGAAGETIELAAGDIFEILPVHRVPDAAVSWILTQDRTFLQSSRTPVFRARLVQPGTYTLNAEISSQDGMTRIPRTFTLHLKPRDTFAVPPEADGLVSSDPPTLRGDFVVLPAGRETVRFIPHTSRTPLNIDLDTSADSDGDGDPANDIANAETFFQLQKTPLTLWFTEPVEGQRVRVSVLAEDGSLAIENREILTAASAARRGISATTLAIAAEDHGERTFQFSAHAEGMPLPDDALLYTWTFGDGAQNLQTNPLHTFAKPGNFTVRVIVRNLRTGKDIATAEIPLTIEAPVSSASSSVSEQVPTEETVTRSRTSAGGGFLRTLLYGLVLLLLAGGAGFGAVVFLRRKSAPRAATSTPAESSTLATHFAQMEQKLLQREEKPKETPSPSVPQPPSSPASNATEAAIVAREREHAEAPQSKALPRIDMQSAPSWLSKGLTTTPSAPPPPSKEDKEQKPTPIVASPAPRPSPSPLPLAPQLPRPPSAGAPAPKSLSPSTSSKEDRGGKEQKPAPMAAPVSPPPPTSPPPVPPAATQPPAPPAATPPSPVLPTTATSPTPRPTIKANEENEENKKTEEIKERTEHIPSPPKPTASAAGTPTEEKPIFLIRADSLEQEAKKGNGTTPPPQK